jgi:NhaP-type Na+/H+ or K+/H+ antiporter
MDYFVVVTVLGVAILAAAVLPAPLRRLPISVPMIVVAAGMTLFALPLGLEGPRPGADDDLAERLTELVVIVSLTGAGLKLRRRVGWRSWATTWRLLGLTMPLTVLAITLLGWSLLGLPIAAAVLLGAVIAPTDPVLASEVQLPGPGADEESDADADADPDDADHGRAVSDDDSVRFALTSEAGLNDGLAFPITNLAIAMAVGGNWFAGWIVHDVFIKLTVGVVAGVVLGWVIARATFRTNSTVSLARSGDGLVAVGITLAVYGATELIHGYGFLAVFVAAVTFRQHESAHAYHATLHDFADGLERIASVLFLLLLGGAAVDGALGGLTPLGAAVAVLIVLVVRPLSGWIGLAGDHHSRRTRGTIAFFGIRGMGTIYYLAHAVNEEFFVDAREVWAVAVFAILVSIVVHGMTAGPVLHRLEQRTVDE